MQKIGKHMQESAAKSTDGGSGKQNEEKKDGSQSGDDKTGEEGKVRDAETK